MPGGHELLEHTADLGIRSWGDSLEEAFEQAASGMIQVLGARASGPGTRRRLRAEGADPGALLVDFLNEVLFLHETEGAAFGTVRIDRLAGSELEADVELTPLVGTPEGIPVKAATLHQLRVERRPDGSAEVRVFLDV